MRMWMVPVEQMCDKHLLGEHVELHMIRGCMEKGKSLQGFIDKGLVDLSQVDCRHNEIAGEMLRRGMMHGSPLRKLEFNVQGGAVDVQKSKVELSERCDVCRNKISCNIMQDVELAGSCVLEEK